LAHLIRSCFRVAKNGRADIITLATGNTVQLAGACALTSTVVAYQFVSCKIIGLLG
jgi:hypothetical protein